MFLIGVPKKNFTIISTEAMISALILLLILQNNVIIRDNIKRKQILYNIIKFNLITSL